MLVKNTVSNGFDPLQALFFDVSTCVRLSTIVCVLVTPVAQRMWTVAVNPGISTISPKRSSPTWVQFRHLLTSKPRKRTYEGNDRFLPVTVGTAAQADGCGQPWNFIDFSKAVIGGASPISSFVHIQNSKAVRRRNQSVFASGGRHCSVT